MDDETLINKSYSRLAAAVIRQYRTDKKANKYVTINPRWLYTLTSLATRYSNKRGKRYEVHVV